MIKAGRYELCDELGRGAMGVVYRAHDPVIGRDVAVKTMHLTGTGTGMTREELIARFQTEARAAGLLTHPNIVVVHDAGEQGGLFYITMELVEGRSLQALLDARQGFPLPRVMRLMEQACSALDFAHQRNVVHRDIKPANLMLTEDDTLKITDFGTAKILQFGTTQTSHVMGTPSYMSPEQVKGKPVDGRSDIFSLGVILYELMTGEKPFPGENITTVIYKILNEEPIPPRALDSSIHPGLSMVIMRALAKGPAARFQNCRELLEALKNHRDLPGPDATLVMPAGGSPANAAGIHEGSSLVRTPVSSPHPTPGAEQPMLRPLLVVPQAENETTKQRGSLLLTLILLGIIGYAGYRVWPPMKDLWQRTHQPADVPAVPPKAPPAAPMASTDTSEAKPDATSSATTPPPVSAPASADGNPAEQPAAMPRGSDERAAPASHNATTTERTAVPAKPTVPAATAAATSLKASWDSQVASLSLADKVKIEVEGNTVTLSGKLTTGEHSQLLARLHDVPPGIRVVDDIGYAEQAQATPGVIISSSPAGANVFIDGQRTLKQTPATIPLDPGTYRIAVAKPGFEPYMGNLIVNAGQPAQMNVDLTPRPAGAGAVWVRSAPQGAEIFVDGKDTGLRTPARVEMPQGAHQVLLTLAGYMASQREVMVRREQNAQVFEVLSSQ